MLFTRTTNTVGNILEARDVQIVIPGLMAAFFNDNLLHNETEIHTTSSNANGNQWRIDGPQLLSTTIFLPPTFGTSSPGQCERHRNFSTNDNAFAPLRQSFCRPKISRPLGCSISGHTTSGQYLPIGTLSQQLSPPFLLSSTHPVIRLVMVYA